MSFCVDIKNKNTSYIRSIVTAKNTNFSDQTTVNSKQSLTNTLQPTNTITNQIPVHVNAATNITVVLAPEL